MSKFELAGGRFSPIRFTIEGHEFAFFKIYTEDYGFMGMADYPDYVLTGVTLAEVRDNMWVTASSEFSTDMANKIYYNVKHHDFKFVDFIKALEKECIEYRK